VNVAAGKFTDLVNNANLAAATSTQDVDTAAPSVQITDDKTGVANSPILYTFTLSEASNTFTLDDITVTGGTKAATLTAVSPTVYTLSVTPDAGSTKSITVDVAAGKFADAVGNNSVAATQSIQEVNTVSPTIAITNDKTAVTNSAILYTFTLSAASTNFSIDDITVTGGTKAATLTAVSPTVYTLSVTPDANSTTPVTVNVAAGKFTDAAGNANVAATQSVQEISTVPVVGKAIDGYLSGSTVFADANGNGIQDAGESSATTDTNGNFTLPSGSTGTIINGMDSSRLYGIKVPN
jgi:hypothetical protein